MIGRWFVGFFKTLFNIWDWDEWFYYVKAGLDPKIPAKDRWKIELRVENKPAETAAEEIMPLNNHLVVLTDKFAQSADEVVFFTTDPDKANALVDQYERELITRTSGNFYYKMIKRRNLDFFHDYKVLGEEPLVEGQEIDPEQEREKFLR